MKNQNHTQADCEQLIHAGQRIGATFGVVSDFNCVQIELIQKYSRTKKRGYEEARRAASHKIILRKQGYKAGYPKEIRLEATYFQCK